MSDEEIRLTVRTKPLYIYRPHGFVAGAIKVVDLQSRSRWERFRDLPETAFPFITIALRIASVRLAGVVRHFQHGRIPTAC